MELPRAVAVVVVVPLLFLVVEFSSRVASCPGSLGDEVPVTVKQEVVPSPAGWPRRPDALPVHALRPHSAGDEKLKVARREGRRGDIGEAIHVRKYQQRRR